MSSSKPRYFNAHPSGKAATTQDRTPCVHCGAACPAHPILLDAQPFCCTGCRTVYQLLEEHGLQRFYDLENTPGIRPRPIDDNDAFDYLNDPVLKPQVLDFSDGIQSRVTFNVPAVHCIACVWLLENIFRMHPGIGRSQVNFSRKEVSISFNEEEISLGRLAALLSSLGYEPLIDKVTKDRAAPSASRRELIRLGIAGFAFGNIMLLSFPSYLGLDAGSNLAFQRFFGYVSLLLSIPVLCYSAADYWQAAWLFLRRRMLTIDFPIFLGMLALFGQSAYEILSGAGEGYLDSFAGLIFFLLCGKWFQRKTYDHLSFERDYTSYFPLSVVRRRPDGTEETIPVSELEAGDHMIIRNQEIIPADARLLQGQAFIDFSFVTGEQDPVIKREGDHIYAGGRQLGGAIELEAQKAVSQSYLTSLWNNEIFHKPEGPNLNSLTNVISRYFTAVVLVLAATAGLYWLQADISRALFAFSSVLIVACPCALALSAPFALGTATRLMGRRHLYLRNAGVVEKMASVDTVVFDKTGTLTQSPSGGVHFNGEALSLAERDAIRSVTRHSTHPVSIRVGASLTDAAITEAENFHELPGCGIEGRVRGLHIRLGSHAWLTACGMDLPAADSGTGSGTAWLAVDGELRGHFVVESRYRKGLKRLISNLPASCRRIVLSGDQDGERPRLEKVFGADTAMHFNQDPQAKLDFVKNLQQQGRRVMMLGDGLNDAGALKQSDVGVAVSEHLAAFTPACDAILDAEALDRTGAHLHLARLARRVIAISIGLSFAYNVVGISFAARGVLSPVIAAILMPVSSISVVAFAVGATEWMARKADRRSA